MTPLVNPLFTRNVQERIMRLMRKRNLNIFIILFLLSACSATPSPQKQESENTESVFREESTKTGDQEQKRPVLKPKEDRGLGYLTYVTFDEIKQTGEVNTEKPTTTVRYVNHEKGISVELPFNPRWG